MMRSAFEVVSACASVLATTKSTPCRPAPIMLFTALPPAPPTPKTVMRGFSSRMSGIFRLMVMVASSLIRGRQERPAPADPPPAAVVLDARLGPSETLAQPLSDPGEIAARAIHQIPPATAGFEIFKMRGLRINQQAGRRGKGGASRRVRQSGDTQRPPDAYWPPENARGQFRQSSQLARAAGEDHAPARLGSKRGGIEPVA